MVSCSCCEMKAGDRPGINYNKYTNEGLCTMYTQILITHLVVAHLSSDSTVLMPLLSCKHTFLDSGKKTGYFWGGSVVAFRFRYLCALALTAP